MQTFIRSAAWAGSLALLGALTACAPQRSAPAPYGYGGGYQTPAPGYSAVPAGTEYGRVSHIEYAQGQAPGQASGVGAVLGAVVGGVLGNQVGGGSGRVAATAVGAIGGAVVGNAVEQRNSRGEAGQGYRISIQLDQGGYRSYDVGTPGDLRVGDRVRLFNGQITRY
ncbi:MAG: glycine zipper 2TM domain-containing protein [Burkholderiaceae bacterium]|nr:glycine zipper 2TM domain-containing protein [Burkholderiaceae bacterium]